jgi:transcriptional regulator GlxA family with amidase domain
VETNGDPEDLLRTSALRTSNSILVARQRAEQELIQAKKALELKTAELAHSLSLMRATLEATLAIEHSMRIGAVVTLPLRAG